jgi:hypothetical protein
MHDQVVAEGSAGGDRGGVSGHCLMITWLLAFATTFAAFRSAWYWHKSSQIADPLQVQLGWLNALIRASGESAVLNRWGAI